MFCFTHTVRMCPSPLPLRIKHGGWRGSLTWRVGSCRREFFWVLFDKLPPRMPKGEKMPSVLVKITFISHREKLRLTYLLTGKCYQKCLPHSALYIQHRAGVYHRGNTKASKLPLPPVVHLRHHLGLKKWTVSHLHGHLNSTTDRQMEKKARERNWN